jgi:hypothetical protein
MESNRSSGAGARKSDSGVRAHRSQPHRRRDYAQLTRDYQLAKQQYEPDDEKQIFDGLTWRYANGELLEVLEQAPARTPWATDGW